MDIDKSVRFSEDVTVHHVEKYAFFLHAAFIRMTDMA
jgi:hypothetical protein